MENLVYHARKMVNESNMADDAKMEVLDLLELDDILALKEYRKLGTVEELRQAKEKQNAKKPSVEGDGESDGQIVYDTWICPCCDKRYEIDYDNYDYCPECGQHIDKSDLE